MYACMYADGYIQVVETITFAEDELLDVGMPGVAGEEAHGEEEEEEEEEDMDIDMDMEEDEVSHPLHASF